MEIEANEEIKRVERGDSEEGAREKASHLVDRLAMSSRSGRKGTESSPEDILDTLNKLYGMDAATALIRDLF